MNMKKCDYEYVYFLRLPGELDWVEGPVVEGRLLCKGCDKKFLLTTIGKHVEKIHCVNTKQWLCVKDAYIAKNIAMGRPVVASANNFERAWNAHAMAMNANSAEQEKEFEEEMTPAGSLDDESFVEPLQHTNREAHLDTRLHLKEHIAQHIAHVSYFRICLKPICVDRVQWPTWPKWDCFVLLALRFFAHHHSDRVLNSMCGSMFITSRCFLRCVVFLM